MGWSEGLLIFMTAISLLVVLNGRRKRLAVLYLFLILILSSIALIPVTRTLFGEELALVRHGWMGITASTLVLVLLARLIRELKPVYTRYPVPFTYSPLIILATYPFILNTESLVILLSMILQGGGLMIALLLYISLYRKFSGHLYYLGGMFLLTLSYLSRWFIDSSPVWATHLLLSTGLILTVIGIKALIQWIDEA